MNNILKILSYITPLSKQDIEYNRVTFNPIGHVYLRRPLFCKDECLVCGKCCITEDNVYLPFEVENMHRTLKEHDINTDIHKVGGDMGYEKIKELVEALEPFKVTINGEEFDMFKCYLPPNTYEFPDRGTLQRCHWDVPVGDELLGCSIHTVSSLTCKMPHIRFFHNAKNNTTSISHSQYGRNWAMKCPAQVSKTDFDEGSLDTAIFNFKLLIKYCEYFKIQTWAPEVLECLELVKQNGESYIDSVVDRDITQGSVKKPISLF